MRTRLIGMLLALALGPAGAQAKDPAVYKKAAWLESVQVDLYRSVQREFRTRYDGAIWARACRQPALAQRLAFDKAELRAWVFDRLLARQDAERISPSDKWMVVNGVVNMTDTYVEGGKAFVKPAREDCEIVIKGLHREFGG